MLYREICRVFSTYLIFLSLALCVPLGVAVYFEYILPPEAHPQPHSTLAFVGTIAIDLFIAFLCRRIGSKAKGRLFRRECLALVVVIWFVTAIIGGLPFYLSGTFDSPLDSYFEAMSGLTTTGASVMHPKEFDPVTGNEIAIRKEVSGPYDAEYMFYGTIDPVRDPVTGESVITGVEAVSKGILFWRSFTQWLGGMGIVVLFVAILPALGVGGKVLYQAEVPGPIKEAVTPRIKETASLLWKLYLIFTVLEIVLLMVTNSEMSLFDASTITFSTISTGGFSVHSASIGIYANAWTEWVVIIFMIAGGVNFSLYFYCLKGKFYRLYEPEFILYLATLFIGSCFIAWNLVGFNKILLNGETGIFSFAESVRHGFFQMVSAQTSTGFVTADFDKWPLMCQTLMLMMMCVGGMSGSTGGGIKVSRFYMTFYILYNKLEQIFRPETVRKFRIGSSDISDKMAITVLFSLIAVLLLIVFGTFFLVVDGVDPETAVSVNVCMINNIGMAFRTAGPTSSFAFLSAFGKLLSSIWMVLGRLELFAVLLIFLPEFWMKDR